MVCGGISTVHGGGYLGKLGGDASDAWKHAGGVISSEGKRVGGQIAQESHNVQDQMAPTIHDAKVKIHVGANRMADNAGHFGAEFDQGRIYMMKDPQVIDAAGTAVGGYFGGAQGAAAGHAMAGSFARGVNGQRQPVYDRRPPQAYSDGGYAGQGYTGGSNGSPGDVEMTYDQAREWQDREQRNQMDRLNKQQEIYNQQRPYMEQNARYQRDLQQTQQIIRGVSGIIQMLNQ